MGLQKILADRHARQADGATIWRTQWFGCPNLAKVENCRIASLHGEPRATVYVQGDADTYFSIPARFYLFGKVINGYLTRDNNGNLVASHCYY